MGSLLQTLKWQTSFWRFAAENAKHNCLSEMGRVSHNVFCFFSFASISQFLAQNLLQNMACSLMDGSISGAASIFESFARNEQPVYTAKPIYRPSRAQPLPSAGSSFRANCLMEFPACDWGIFKSGGNDGRFQMDLDKKNNSPSCS